VGVRGRVLSVAVFESPARVAGLDAVEGYYPTVIDKETFERVRSMRIDAKAPLRGRHAAGTVQNIFGGLARCPCCDATMTLVNKGAGNGRRYLICTKAKAGAGCR